MADSHIDDGRLVCSSYALPSIPSAVAAVHRYTGSIHPFLFGTAEADGPNHVYYFEYDEALNQLNDPIAYPFPGEVHSITTSPSHPTKAFIVSSEPDGIPGVDPTVGGLYEFPSGFGSTGDYGSTPQLVQMGKVPSLPPSSSSSSSSSSLSSSSPSSGGGKSGQGLGTSSPLFQPHTPVPGVQMTPTTWAHHLAAITGRSQPPAPPLGTDLFRSGHGAPFTHRYPSHLRKVLWPVTTTASGGSGASGHRPAGSTLGKPSSSASSSPGSSSTCLAVYSDCVGLYDISSSTEFQLQSITPRVVDGITDTQWEPVIHGGHAFHVATGSKLCSFDTRTMRETRVLQTPHPHITSLDLNIVDPRLAVTGGSDGVVAVWDFRKPSHAVCMVQPFHHAVTKLQYNPFHDQYIAAAGADGLMMVLSLPSVSTASQLFPSSASLAGGAGGPTTAAGTASAITTTPTAGAAARLYASSPKAGIAGGVTYSPMYNNDPSTIFPRIDNPIIPPQQSFASVYGQHQQQHQQHHQQQPPHGMGIGSTHSSHTRPYGSTNPSISTLSTTQRLATPNSSGTGHHDPQIPSGSTSTLQDGIQMVNMQHCDAISSLHWSSTSPWFLLSASFDGVIYANRITSNPIEASLAA